MPRIDRFWRTTQDNSLSAFLAALTPSPAAADKHSALSTSAVSNRSFCSFGLGHRPQVASGQVATPRRIGETSHLLLPAAPVV